MNITYRTVAWLILLCSTLCTALGQPTTDTLTLSRAEAETLFLQRNLPLLAGKLEIDEAKAQVIQAKLWPNPSISVGEINLWANAGAEASGRLFGNWGNHQQVAVEIEQVIQTAGKRKKLIAVHEAGVAIAEQGFEDLLRSLRVELRAQLADLLVAQQRETAYQRVLGALRRLAAGYQRQVELGNVSRAEYMRLKASEIEFMKALDDIKQDARSAQATLKSLLGVAPEQELMLAEEAVVPVSMNAITQLDPSTVAAWAAQFNAELKALGFTARQAEHQLAYERAQRTPDIEVGINYDRGGNIMRDFVGIGVSMDLPFFNRNQGNIKAAQHNLQRQRLLEQHRRHEVQAEAVRVLSGLETAMARREAIGADYAVDLDGVLSAYHRNFADRTISLLEYLDFLEAYLSVKDTVLETDKEVEVQYETLRYHVGDNLP